MFAKVMLFVVLVGAVAAEYAYSSQYIDKYDGHHEPVHHGGYEHGHDEHFDYYTYPKYEFEYEVKDPHTHDYKVQHESRDGDVVKGFYSLHEPDGTVRDVHYHGDKHSGFHADVKHSIHHIIPENHHYHY
uniref:Cuticular protein RR-2 motif 118 n=1 Tax=Antheraea yamamai TaxID=7121 RepID=G8FVQ2_ANTYA|nr:cuticular protein RR-2 motif 118 [Antheraea yamamai]